MVCEDKVYFVKRLTCSNPYDEEAEPYTRYDSASMAEAEGFDPPWAFTPKLFSRHFNLSEIKEF